MAKMINVSSVQDVTVQLKEAKALPIPSNRGFITAKLSTVIFLEEANIKNTRLTDHVRPITAVTLSFTQDFFISCSADKIILWHLDALDVHVEGGDPVSGTTIGVNLGPISQCSISCNNEWLALSKEHEIWIVRLKWRPAGGLGEVEHHAVLPNVSLIGSGSSFSPVDGDLLVTVEDSNVFKLWNVRSTQVIHQASVLGSHRITFCAFSSTWPWLLLVGSNRGVVHLFRLKVPAENMISAPRLLIALDLTRSQTNVTTSITSTVDSEHSKNDVRKRVQDVPVPLEENTTEAGCIILNAILVESADIDKSNDECVDELPNGFTNNNSTLRSLLKPGPILITCSNQGLAVYNVNPAECSCFFPFSELSIGNIQAPLPFLDYAVLSGLTTQNVYCVLRALGGTQAVSFSFQVESKQGTNANPPISMLARNPVSSKSPLRVQMKSNPGSCVYNTGTSIQNKPRRKIRSSGYGLPPKALTFASGKNNIPFNKSLIQISNSKERTKKNEDESSIISVRSAKFLMPDQDSDSKFWNPPLKLEKKLLLEEQYGAALHLGMSGDGTQLACSSKKLITVLNANKLNLEDCISLVGHDSGVNSVAFSFDNAWLVSGSDDGSSKVWDWKNKRCVLDIGSHSTEEKKTSAHQKTKKNGTRSKVTQASFYYMDHFIVQAVGSHLNLFCHRLHEDGTDASRSSWRRVTSINLPAQEVTCFSAANCFHSNYLIAGSSNRSLLVYDVDAESLAMSISGAHSRAPHTLCALTGSSKIAQPARILDLVLSSAICDGVKLWDLRTARCVQKYSRHCNRAHLSGIDISPCCQYVAVASEDKCVYVYDSRQCHDYLWKLGGFTVPVMDVLFSPSKPQLFAAGLNGSILSFSGQ